MAVTGVIRMQLISISSAAKPRLRSIYPISEPDGSCVLLYDLERTFIFEVPAEFRRTIAQALLGSNFDDALGEWLRSEDLITNQDRTSWAQGSQPSLPQVTDVSLDLSGSCNLSCVYCFEHDINSRIGPMSEATAMAAVEFAFNKSPSAREVVLHFGSGEPLLRFDLLQRVIAEAERRAALSGRQLRCELTTNATLVTTDIACFLRDHSFNVRVSCDGPPALHNRFRPFSRGRDSYAAVLSGLRLLLEYLPDRVTVNSVLSSGTRLSILWSWAKELRLRHFHVIKVGAYSDRDVNLREAELKNFREDLSAICDDLFDDLAEDRIPIDYQPITKIVRRLMIPQPITRFCGVAGSYLGVAADGQVYPCFRHLGVSEYHLGNIWNGVDDTKRRSFLGREAADVDSRPVCQNCWARYMCGGGCYADSTVYSADKLAPQAYHCPFWKTEIEIAIRFYKRLVQTDPLYCIRLFGDEPDMMFERLDEAGFLQRKNCS